MLSRADKMTLLRPELPLDSSEYALSGFLKGNTARHNSSFRERSLPDWYTTPGSDRRGFALRPYFMQYAFMLDGFLANIQSGAFFVLLFI